MGSILSGPWDVQAQKSAIQRSQRADSINEQRVKDAWMKSDYFLPAFGGGSSGLTTQFGNEFKDLFDQTNPNNLYGSPATRFANFSSAADEFRPTLTAGENLAKDVVSGDIGQRRVASFAPIAAARDRGVAVTREAQTQSINDILNRIEAGQRASGFSGASSAGDALKADAARKIAATTAAQQAGVDVANATDLANVQNNALSEQLAGRGFANDLLSNRLKYNLTPEMQTILSSIGNYSARTGAASPFMSINKPPVLMKKAYPSEHGLWMKATGDALSEIEDLLISYYSGGAASSKGSSRVTDQGGGGSGMSGLQSQEQGGNGAVDRSGGNLNSDFFA
jgi:hypothetical protein